MKASAKLIFVSLAVWHQPIGATPFDMADVFVNVCTLGQAEFSKGSVVPIEWSALPSSARDFRPYLNDTRAYRIVKPKSGFLIVGTGDSTEGTSQNPVCGIATRHISFNKLSDSIYSSSKSQYKWTLHNPKSAKINSSYSNNGIRLSYDQLRDGLIYIESVVEKSLTEDLRIKKTKKMDFDPR
jgi:hypothetical protein